MSAMSSRDQNLAALAALPPATPDNDRLPVDIDLALLALPIRPAHIGALTAIRQQVAALGKDRDAWRREFDLYARSWLRHLGGTIFNKRHRIDALAMTTEHQRIGYERARAAGLIGEAYGSGPVEGYIHPDNVAEVAACVDLVRRMAANSSIGRPFAESEVIRYSSSHYEESRTICSMSVANAGTAQSVDQEAPAV